VALHGLLRALTSTPDSPTQHLEREQALAKQFAEILHFTLRFDELKANKETVSFTPSLFLRFKSKMTNPAIQNDFSYYRRTLNRMRINNIPNKNLPIENTTDCLSTMASICKVMLETPEYRNRFASEETAPFCLRVMVGVIILYDYVHPVGAFAKSSKIDMKGCIKVLKDQPANNVEGLLNALRVPETRKCNDYPPLKPSEKLVIPYL
ncbi:hypothetical protein Z043_102775, partial [Scleropages formosus]